MRSVIAMMVVGVLAVPAIVSAKEVAGSWKWTGGKTNADTQAVQQALEHLEGVHKAKVTATVIRLTFDDTKVDAGKVSTAVSSAGPYSVVAKTANKSEPSSPGKTQK